MIYELHMRYQRCGNCFCQWLASGSVRRTAHHLPAPRSLQMQMVTQSTCIEVHFSARLRVGKGEGVCR